jgi:hypothetical protein
MDEIRIGRLIGAVFVAAVTLWWFLGAKRGENAAVGRIKDEGGEILSYSTIGLLFVDPFKHSTSDAAGHCFRVRYKDRAGTWFVRTSSKRPEGEWLWVDEKGADSLPVARSDDSRVVAKVGRIPSWVFGIGFALLIVALLIGTSFTRKP